MSTEWCKYCGEGDGVCAYCEAREELRQRGRLIEETRGELHNTQLWSRRWKALAKRMRRRHRRAMDLALADRDGARAEVDQRISDLTREWSAQTRLRQELKASRAAHERAMSERDAAHIELERRTAWSNARIAELEVRLECTMQRAQWDLDWRIEAEAETRRLEARIAQAVAELEAFFALNATEQIDPPGIQHIERALEILRMSCDNPDCDDACKRLHGPPAGPEMPDGWSFSPAIGGAFVSKREDGGHYALTLTLLRALLATQGLRIVTEDEVACHRQHEQCMKLLERCFCYLPKCKLEELVIEMLSKGELPEGWDK